MTMVRYGLIGKPLGHSFSARRFADFFEAAGIDARYDNFELASAGELTALVDDIPDLRGLNVTTPYKQAVMPMLSSLTRTASAIGAVNCIKIDRSGDEISLVGHNTDAAGFEAMLDGIDLTDIRALVLGSGGASRAVRHVLRQREIPYIMVSHSGAAGAIAYEDLDAEVMSIHRLIINATPLGMKHTADRCPAIPYDFVSGRHVCLDLIYNPEVTEFMRRCAACGAIVRNGLRMLIAQAEASYEFWTNQ